MPNIVTSIGWFAFCDCISLTSLNLPDGLGDIGLGTFYDCTSLESVNVPEGVTRIGNSAFMYCKSLSSITIPDTVTYIDMMAFCYCTGLKELTMPIDIEANSRFYENALTSVTLTKGTTGICATNGENYQYTPWYNCRETLTSASVGEGVVSLDDYLFAGCDHLTTLSVGTVNGSFVFGGDVISEILSEGLTSVGISQMVSSDLPQYVREAVGDRPVFDVSAGAVSDLGGPTAISLKYDLGENEDPKGLSIWHITDSGIEEIPCTYSDGYVSFETNHLSYYAIMYKEPASAVPGPVALVAFAVAIAIIAFAGIALWLRTGRN